MDAFAFDADFDFADFDFDFTFVFVFAFAVERNNGILSHAEQVGGLKYMLMFSHAMCCIEFNI